MYENVVKMNVFCIKKCAWKYMCVCVCVCVCVYTHSHAV